MARSLQSALAPSFAMGLAIALTACGGSQAPPPARVKLVDVGSGELVTPPEPDGERTLLAEDFSVGSADWRTLTDDTDPLNPRPGLLETRPGSEDGRSFLTLSGRRGAVFRLVEVEPGAAYEFSGQVRARDVEPATRPFFGATTWLAELARFGPPEEVFRGEKGKWFVTRHLFPSAAGEEGWQPRRRLFRTGPRTHGLIVAGLLGVSEEVLAGEVDCTAFELRRVPDRRYWEQELAKAVSVRFAGEPTPDDWRARRLVRATLGADARPSIALLPAETLRVTVRVPGGTPRLETGAGPWPPGMVAGRGGELVFVARVDGEELMREPVSVPGKIDSARWSELALDLTRFAGETVTLELSAEGDLPGVLGAPALVDTSYRPTEPNLLLVSIDTLRADRVGAYGHPGGNTPHLDALAADGVFFRHVVTQAPYTLPAHASLFSGQFPTVHGVQRGGDVFSPGRSPILARILGERGYRTQAFTGGGFVAAAFGFDKGFDGFDDVDPIRPRESRYFEILPPDLVREHGPQRVHAWLAEHADEPFFLFVHTYTVHDYDAPAEYVTCHERGCTSDRTDFRDWRMSARFIERGFVPAPIDPADRAHVEHLYDAALRYTDDVIGGLLAKVEELGIAERTIVAITSDHGEEIFERGFLQHGKTVYEETTRIPMILRIPGVPPRTIEAPAMLVDLAPTILGAMGLDLDPRMQGLDLLRTDPGERMLWSEVHDDFTHKYALRDPSGWKLIHGPLDADVVIPNRLEWELYDLADDPGELDDRTESRPEELERLQTAFEQRLAALQRLAEGLADVGQGELDEETRERLRALGYMQ